MVHFKNFIHCLTLYTLLIYCLLVYIYLNDDVDWMDDHCFEASS
jgi:hypothetical protein